MRRWVCERACACPVSIDPPDPGTLHTPVKPRAKIFFAMAETPSTPAGSNIPMRSVVRQDNIVRLAVSTDVKDGLLPSLVYFDQVGGRMGS